MDDLRRAIELIQETARLNEAQLEHLTEDDQQVIADARARLERAVDRAGTKIAGIFPDTGPYRRELYPKHIAFLNAGRTARERCFMAGNRIGKTYLGLYEVSCHLLGFYQPWWQGRKFNEPIQAIVAGDTAETVRDILQAEMLGRAMPDGKNRLRLKGDGLIPPGAIVQDAIEFRQGVRVASEVGVRYRDSKTEFSTLSLRAYAQKRESFQGVARHVIMLDEEMPEDIYDECQIRLMTTRGLLIVTFTPLKGVSPVVQRFLTDAGQIARSADPYSAVQEMVRYREMLMAGAMR